MPVITFLIFYLLGFLTHFLLYKDLESNMKKLLFFFFSFKLGQKYLPENLTSSLVHLNPVVNSNIKTSFV